MKYSWESFKKIILSLVKILVGKDLFEYYDFLRVVEKQSDPRQWTSDAFRFDVRGRCMKGEKT